MPTNILVVDDNPTFRECFCALLSVTFRQLQIVPAGDATAAMRIFQQMPFDLLITDYQLNARSGTQLIRHIKQLPGDACNPHIPMVLMSTNPDIGVFARTLQVAFLHKPTDSATLRTVVGPLIPQARTNTGILLRRPQPDQVTH